MDSCIVESSSTSDEGNENEAQINRMAWSCNSWRCISSYFCRRHLIMGMSRHDAYYEPEDYDNRSDEIEARAWELMKVGGPYDYRTSGAISEMMGELDIDQAKALQDVINSGDYEALGRKIIAMSCDYMERIATEVAEFEIND